ncbi:MAG: hypothetical protein KGZ96_13070 [Clostridia bacterium]|nr:hypothetical protein [Clostridia bacterium]
MFKRKSKLTKIVILVVSLILVSTSMVMAQPLKADELFVSIWPEYDEPGVLIVYSGEVRNTSSEPFEGRVLLNIPKGVAKAEMVCETEQGMLCLPHEIKQMEDFAQISWVVSKPIKPGGVLPFMAEFYYNPIEGEVDKNFSYNFFPSVDIDRLTFDVKEPFDAANFKIDPVFDYIGDDNNGFSTYRYVLLNLEEGENQEITISYTRDSNAPSIDRTLVTGPSSNQAKLGGGGPSLNSTTIILLSSFLGLMGFFMFYALKGNNQRDKNKSKANSKVSKKTTSIENRSDEQKKKLRKLLLDQKITEATYKELVKELEK